MVLFLFVIMMARLDLEELKKNFLAHMSVALPVGGILLFEMFAIISYGFSDYSSSEKIYLHLVILTKLACVCIQSTFLLFRRQQLFCWLP